MPAIDDNAQRQLQALGDFIKGQRKLAELSLRELAARTNVSNPYLSQIERGLHEPSVRVLKAIVTDGVRRDYKERTLQLNRISNLITTRSDSFTCYVLIQGWENAESTDVVNRPPRPVVQRRVGFIVDRSHVTADPVSFGKITKQFFYNN